MTHYESIRYSKWVYDKEFKEFKRVSLLEYMTHAFSHNIFEDSVITKYISINLPSSVEQVPELIYFLYGVEKPK